MSALPFDLTAFGELSIGAQLATRNFALQVEAYELGAERDYVVGVDLSTEPAKRVRVFLREGAADENRPVPLRLYGLKPGDPFVDARDQDTNQRCYSPPGSVLMVQLAFDDRAGGGISANWINRVASNEELETGQAVVLANVWAKLARPRAPRDLRAKGFCVCDVIHEQRLVRTKTAVAVDDALFTVLSSTTTEMRGRHVALLQLRNSAGQVKTKVIERRIVKDAADYAPESPVESAGRLWSSMSQELRDGIRAAIDSGELVAAVIPCTRFRLVGRSLELALGPLKSRAHLAWERFLISPDGDAADSGFCRCTIVVQRHRTAVEDPGNDDEGFVTGIWTDTNPPKVHRLDELQFIKF